MPADCVILIPVYREKMDQYQRISLNRCFSILGRYPIRIIAPDSLDLEEYYQLFNGSADFAAVRFHRKYFRSPQTYNRLLKSLSFYRRWTDYDYFLMYHTDAYVFRDELKYWIAKGYDYIGAPIYEYDGTVSPGNYLGVGNGGFSLHKVSTAMNVLESMRKVYPIKDLIDWYCQYNFKGKIKHSPYLFRMLVGLGGWSHHRINYSRINEDIFWGIQVPDVFPDFKVACFKEACRFSMEYNCTELLALNDSKLPFGCHQWYKGEFFDFWKDKIQELEV